MSRSHPHSGELAGASPSFAELFTPKLVTVLREGYGVSQLRRDATAGLTVAIVALPLSMAIAIASGASPTQGLVTAIVGGFLVSALGGSRYQIGGPAGAFIVLVAASIARHGLDGMALAVALSGLMLMAAGWLRLGGYVRLIPYPVTVGFTAGIGAIILASQLKDLFGLTLAGPEPGAILPKLEALAAAAGSFNPHAGALAAGVIAFILFMRAWKPQFPGLLVAVAGAAFAAWALRLPVETVASRFGELPAGLPAPKLPPLDPARILAVLPDAFAFALLGAIESLLSAVVADGMTGRRHRSNCELVAQGAANIASALFGGLCVTGTIARTATNVRAGAVGPVSGMLHSGFLLVFLLFAAPLIGFIPLAALAGVLTVVALNMIERHAIAAIMRASRGDALVLAATLLLTVFRDLTEGIVVGFALGTMLFIDRMSKALRLEANAPLIPRDIPDSALTPPPPEDADTVTYRMSGAFFFGAASTVAGVLDRISETRQRFVLDLTGVPFLDSTAAQVLVGLAKKSERRGVDFRIAGTDRAMRRLLMTHGLPNPRRHFMKFNTSREP